MLFTPKLIAYNNSGESLTLNRAGALGQPIRVIPRAHSAFRRVRLKGTGHAALKAAKMRANKEARPGDNRFHIIKDKDGKHAGLWQYNSSLEAGLRTLPESLCFEPLKDGVRLIACLEGVEGQVWHDGIIVASRWWPNEPSEKHWQTFLRVTPYEFATELPFKPAVSPPLYRTDLPLLGLDIHRIESFVSPMHIATVIAPIVVCITAFMGTQLFRYKTELGAVEANKVEISQVARQVIAHRRKALANVNLLQKYAHFDNEEAFLSGLHSLTSVLKDQGVKITRVSLNEGEFNFTLTGQPKISGPELVSALEESPVLTDVSISGSRQKNLKINAKIAPMSDKTTTTERSQ